MASAKQVFNRDMDSYLSRRKTPKRIIRLTLGPSGDDGRPGLWGSMFARRTHARPMPADEEVDVDTIEEEIKELDAEIEEAQEFEAEAKHERDGLFKRFLRSLKGDDKFNEDEEIIVGPPQVPTIDPEVAEVLKLSFKWISQLPPNKLSQFKESPDSTKYKNCLLKYGLVREKK